MVKSAAFADVHQETLQDLMLDEYFYGFVFCKDGRFKHDATSTFLSILKEIIESDVNTATASKTTESTPAIIQEVCNPISVQSALGSSDRAFSQSFARCKSLVMKHSSASYHGSCAAVFRVPTKQDAKRILDYFTSTAIFKQRAVRSRIHVGWVRTGTHSNI